MMELKNHIKSHKVLFLSSLLIFVVILNGVIQKAAQANPNKIQIVTMEMPPYGFSLENGNISGLFQEINQEILKDSGLSGEISLLPLKRLMRGLHQKAHHCAILGNTDYVRENFLLLEPLGKQLQIGAIGQRDVKLAVYDDLYNLRVGVAIGTKLWDRFDNDQNIPRTETTNYQQGMIMLHRGRIDVMTGVIESLKYLAYNIDGQFVKTLGSPFIFQNIELYFVCQQGFENHLYAQPLRQSIMKLRDKGSINLLVDKYLK